MKKRIFSILLVVVMTFAMVACGTQETTNDVPVSTETIEATVESDENSEAVSETEQATEAPVNEVVENAESVSETESAESASTPETSTEENSEAVSEPEQATEAPVDEASVPEFTVTDLNATKYAIQVVNVRSGPSTDFDKIGSLSTNQEVQVIFRCNETGWYKFIWTDGSEAYVSDKYLADEKVEVAPPASNNNGSGSAASGKKNWSDFYQEYTWYDMNDFMFIIVDSRAEGGSNGIDYSGANATLDARFPGENVYSGAGLELRDGHWMFFSYRAGTLVDSFVEPFM